MIEYRVIYELTQNASFSLFDELLSSFVSYLFMFMIWKVAMNGEFKKLGIVITIIYWLSVVDTIYKKSSTEDISSYQIAEGEASEYIQASYYNRRGGSFVVEGVKFAIDMHGIDSMYKTPLHFANGRRVKIYHKNSKIIKFWIEDYRVILEQKCDDNNYTACFELSRKYQEINRTKAQNLVLKSTKSSNSYYSLVVSMLYRHGILFEKNLTKAELFYDKASQKENISGCKEREKKAIKIEFKKPKEDNSSLDFFNMMD